jgi:hypothetical protein
MHVLLYNWNTDWEDENVPDGTSPDNLDVFIDLGQGLAAIDALPKTNTFDGGTNEPT